MERGENRWEKKKKVAWWEKGAGKAPGMVDGGKSCVNTKTLEIQWGRETLRTLVKNRQKKTRSPSEEKRVNPANKDEG